MKERIKARKLAHLEHEKKILLKQALKDIQDPKERAKFIYVPNFDNNPKIEKTIKEESDSKTDEDYYSSLSSTEIAE